MSTDAEDLTPDGAEALRLLRGLSGDPVGIVNREEGGDAADTNAPEGAIDEAVGATDPGAPAVDPAGGSAIAPPPASTPPGDAPVIYEDRAGFLAQREAIAERLYRVRLGHGDGAPATPAEWRDTMIVESYVTSIELRLSLAELAVFLEEGRTLMSGGGMAKLMGFMGKGKKQ